MEVSVRWYRPPLEGKSFSLSYLFTLSTVISLKKYERRVLLIHIYKTFWSNAADSFSEGRTESEGNKVYENGESEGASKV